MIRSPNKESLLFVSLGPPSASSSRSPQGFAVVSSDFNVSLS